MAGEQTVGSLVRRYRQAVPLTQQELADKVGLHLKAIQKIELGKAQPRPSTIRKLAEALGVDARQLAEAVHPN